jgi:hypothetical protein
MKKECIKAQNLFSLFIDNKINDTDLIWLNNHLDSCPECVKELNKTKKVLNTLKVLKQENLPFDFYFKLNKVLDKIEEKGKNNMFVFNKQFIFRAGLVFATVIFGSFLTLKIVLDNKKVISPDLSVEKQISQLQDIKKEHPISVERENKLIATQKQQDITIEQKTFASSVPSMAEIEYNQPRVPFNLISTGNSSGYENNKMVNRIYMQPIPGKSYYELNQKQIKNDFDARIFGFVIDNDETKEKLCAKYNISEIPQIDFNSEMLILITGEAISSNNYSVEIINAIKEINKIVVLYKINNFNNGDLVNMQINTRYYDFKIISKTQLPIVFKRIE